MRTRLFQVIVALSSLALVACQPPGGSDACVRQETRQARIFALSAPASALAKADRAQAELRLDMHAVQAALHASEDPTAADRRHHRTSDLSSTGEPHG